MYKKRFLLFGFPEHYPTGGWNDFISQHDTKEEVHDAIREHTGRVSYYQIVDTETGEIQEQSFTELKS